MTPSVQDEQAVLDWLTSQGLTITHRFPNRLLVDVAGTAATIERVFGVTMNSYQVGSRTCYSNDRDPQIPSNLVNIIHSVGGLNNVEVMHPANSKMKEPVFPDYVPGPVVSAPASLHTNGDSSKLPLGMKKTSLKSGVSPNFTSGPPYDPQDIYNIAAYDASALYNLGHCCNPTQIHGGTADANNVGIRRRKCHRDVIVASGSGSVITGGCSQRPSLPDHGSENGIGRIHVRSVVTKRLFA